MNYVVALCEAVDKTRAGNDAEPMLEVSSTMPDLEEVCRISLSTWNNDYKGMKKMLTLIETQAAAARKTPFEGDTFADVMEPFLQHATGVINELGKQYDRVVKFFEDTLILFAEDPKKVACEDFFGDLVLGFTRAFDKARNQNEKKRLMAEKASKQKAAEGEKKKKTSTMKKGLSAVDKITKKLRRENPDDVMSKLRGPKKGKGRRGSAKTKAAGADGEAGMALPGMAGQGARAPRAKGPRRLSAQAPPAKGAGGSKSGELASIFSRKAKKK
mmetsp:Transcript_77927/g.223754  ORF Transcript_77927/g.223754 Transcript_77927/m.223754 type:complete len:272 (-) Transcript_77927:194-1009(-)